MAHEMRARAWLTTGMRFAAEAGSGHSVMLDASERDGGRNAGFRPMELLLVGLAGCTAMDVIAILRKKGQRVVAYEVQVHAELADEHPMIFRAITVRHVLTGHHLDPVAVARAVDLSARKDCSVGAMLDKAVEITHVFHVVEATEWIPEGIADLVVIP